MLNTNVKKRKYISRNFLYRLHTITTITVPIAIMCFFMRGIVVALFSALVLTIGIINDLNRQESTGN